MIGCDDLGEVKFIVKILPEDAWSHRVGDGEGFLTRPTCSLDTLGTVVVKCVKCAKCAGLQRLPQLPQPSKCAD